jgi:hypothetical protein
MRALVVYESMFGNTRAVAEAIATGLAAVGEVEALEVAEAPTGHLSGIDLLVVGGPTHALGLSREQTRASAVDETDQPLVSPGTGLREWLAALESPEGPIAAATFDTRTQRPRLPGSAAVAAGRRLRRLGFARALRPETFWVGGMTGPLVDGELERAHMWGLALAEQVAPVA